MDVVFYAGLDDNQLQSKLSKANSGITKALGGIPGPISGAGRALGAFAGSLGGVVGIGATLVGLWVKWKRDQERITEEVAKTKREYQQLAREAANAAAPVTVGGLVGAFGSDELQKRAAILRKVDEIRQAEHKRIQAEYEAARVAGDYYDSYVERAKIETQLQQIREKMLSDLDRESTLRAAADSSRLRAAAFAAQEATAEAAVVEEMQRHAEELEKIQRLSQDRPVEAKALGDVESSRHAARMDEIRAEEIGRQSAAERNAAKKDEERIAAEQRARMIDLELQKQQALLSGDEDRAEAVQRLLEHEKRLAEIRELEVDASVRQSLIDKENANYAIGGPPGRARSQFSTGAAGVGFLNQQSVAIAALGGDSTTQFAREQVSQQKITNTKIDQLISETRRRSNVAVLG